MQEEREKEDEVLSMSMLMKQSSKFISDQDHNIDSLISEKMLFANHREKSVYFHASCQHCKGKLIPVY